MSHEPTEAQLRILAKKLMSEGSGFRRITPRDRVNDVNVELVVSDDGEDEIFRTFDRMPVTQAMGS